MPALDQLAVRQSDAQPLDQNTAPCKPAGSKNKTRKIAKIYLNDFLTINLMLLFAIYQLLKGSLSAEYLGNLYDMTMIVEVKRGEFVESIHECSVSVVDADGVIVEEHGNVSDPIFPRSAIKAFQALAMVESGAAKHFGFTEQELAMCCSSHSGEDRHADHVVDMLSKLGLKEEALNCGPSWPRRASYARNYAVAGGHANALRHNCSGKHSGFLCLACHLSEDVEDYTAYDHPVQKEVAAVIEAITGFTLREIPEIDGCSAPAHQLPLHAIALGFARFATGRGLEPQRKEAAETLYNACTTFPELVGGDNRYDSLIMKAAPKALFAKTGAEGVYCGAIPDRGIGIAIKCHDGAARAAELAFGAVVEKYAGHLMENQTQTNLINAAGQLVGAIEVKA
ncbi:MAG: asparaginase [Hyphomicrobiales bacterium]|nr:MAG: asparaginase [Hyphomicrobiales bacterium]